MLKRIAQALCCADTSAASPEQTDEHIIRRTEDLHDRKEVIENQTHDSRAVKTDPVKLSSEAKQEKSNVIREEPPRIVARPKRLKIEPNLVPSDPAHEEHIVEDVKNSSPGPDNVLKMAQAASNAFSAMVNGTSKKKLVLNAFVEMCSGHQSPGLWRHPDDQSANFNTLSHWTNLAQLLEAGKFHGIFIADVLGGYDVYGGPRNLAPAISSGAQWPVNEPLAVVPAMAAVTKSIGFGVTVSTSYEQPYHLARRLSTVDHLTDGRLAWNVVTGYLDSAARNLGHGNGQLPHDERYAMCEEYMEVMYKLWNASWRTDAVALDRKSGVYTYPDRVREINHVGKYFDVPGPHMCQPSPQRTPVIMQAGTSQAGKEFAAKHAEAIFVSAHSPAACAHAIKDIRTKANALGRDGLRIKFLAKMCPVIGRTEEEAWSKYNEYKSYGDIEGALALFGGWTGTDMAKYGDDEELRFVESNAIRSYIEGLVKYAPKVGKWTKKTLAEHIIVGGLGATPVGTPEQIANAMEEWVNEADVDGFNIAYAIFPQTFKDVIELLLPVLRRRGLFWSDYTAPCGTYRENLSTHVGQKEPAEDHPAASFIWRPPENGSPDEATGFSKGMDDTNSTKRDASGATDSSLSAKDVIQQERPAFSRSYSSSEAVG